MLLGSKPEAHRDESLLAQVEREARELARKERIASAGGQLLGAAFAFLGEILPGSGDSEQTSQLAECLEKGGDGKMKLTITLPDEAMLDNLARSLARIAGGGLG